MYEAAFTEAQPSDDQGQKEEGNKREFYKTVLNKTQDETAPILKISATPIDRDGVSECCAI